jgi:hypothetical protein
MHAGASMGRGRPTPTGEPARNSSHTLPPGANVEQPAQPAVIGAEHHGDAGDHDRSPPMITPAGCVLSCLENLGSKPVESRDLAREQKQMGAIGCALVIHMDGSRQQVNRASQTVRCAGRPGA